MASEQGTADGWTVAIYAAIQLVVAALCAFMVNFQQMAVAGCGSRCDYEGAYAANVFLWVAGGLITLATIVTLITLRRLRWRAWPVAAASVLCTVAAAAISLSLLNSALRG